MGLHKNPAEHYNFVHPTAISSLYYIQKLILGLMGLNMMIDCPYIPVVLITLHPLWIINLY